MKENKEIIKRRRKILQGVVVSDKMEKTAVVKVERLVQHPLYKKRLKKSKKYKIHDMGNICQIGDRVKLIECRPISKDKCWRLLEVVQKAI